MSNDCATCWKLKNNFWKGSDWKWTSEEYHFLQRQIYQKIQLKRKQLKQTIYVCIYKCEPVHVNARSKAERNFVGTMYAHLECVWGTKFEHTFDQSQERSTYPSKGRLASGIDRWVGRGHLFSLGNMIE